MGSTRTESEGQSLNPLAIFDRRIKQFADAAGSDPTLTAVVFYLSLAIVVSMVVVVAISAAGTVKLQATVVVVSGMISVVVLVIALILSGDRPARKAEVHGEQLLAKKAKYRGETNRSRNG